MLCETMGKCVDVGLNDVEREVDEQQIKVI